MMIRSSWHCRSRPASRYGKRTAMRARPGAPRPSSPPRTGAELIAYGGSFARGDHSRTGTNAGVSPAVTDRDADTSRRRRAVDRHQRRLWIATPVVAVRHRADGVLAPSILCRHQRKGKSGLAWSVKGRAPFTMTPLAYRGLLFVLATNGVLDAYELTGEEVYRARVPEIGSGFSASPVAADGKIYLGNEDGAMASSRRIGRSAMSRQTTWESRSWPRPRCRGRPVRPHNEQRVCDQAHDEAVMSVEAPAVVTPVVPPRG